MSSQSQRLFVALDFPDAPRAMALANQLTPLGVGFKVGLQLFYAEGMSLVKQLQRDGQTVFVDLKLHDIPNTVAGAVDSLVRKGVRFLNIHAQGGPEMMQAAVEAGRKAAEATQQEPPTIIGVTLLTSLSGQHLRDFLFVESASIEEYVRHLALQAQQCRLDGVVCSAHEAPAIRKACGDHFLLVTPGIRPSEASVQDQSRVITPAQALRNGADYLVVGRPITDAADPVAAAKQILAEMQGITV